MTTGRTSETEGFSRAIFDSITGLIVVIDRAGVIREANRRWLQVMNGNLKASPGGNYFEVCGWWMGAGTEQCEAIVAGLRQLFDKPGTSFESTFCALAIPGEPVFVLRAALLDYPGAPLAAIVHNEAVPMQTALMQLARSRAPEAAESKELPTRDRLHAGTLDVPAETGRTASRSRVSLDFARLAEIYEDILELALVHRVYKVSGSLSVRLKLLAEDLGSRKAHPRDVIEIHQAAFTHKSRGLAPTRAELLLEESRLVLLELMGYLVSFYRGSNDSKDRHVKGTRIPPAKEG